MSELTATDLRLERTIDASPEEAFDAWTNPEVLRRWWAADPTWVTPVVEVDLRVGGRYRLSMEDPANGTTHTVGGEYREVRRPERLVYSWSWERSDGQPDHTSTVTVEFLGEGERTTIVLEHTDLASSESRDGHRKGWLACFDNLQARGIFARALESQ
ncbi:MAG TPA: SRPBCC domain-containing protein [Solirubrobacteraceae bacterium]